MTPTEKIIGGLVVGGLIGLHANDKSGQQPTKASVAVVFASTTATNTTLSLVMDSIADVEHIVDPPVVILNSTINSRSA